MQRVLSLPHVISHKPTSHQFVCATENAPIVPIRRPPPTTAFVVAMPTTLDFTHLDTKNDPSPEVASTRRTLRDLSLSVAKSKRMVVVTGAGISCSCGIPVGLFITPRLFLHVRLHFIKHAGFSLVRRPLCAREGSTSQRPCSWKRSVQRRCFSRLDHDPNLLHIHGRTQVRD